MTHLVLLPGMDGTGELFAPLMHRLDKAITTQVIRYPTHEKLGYAELEMRVHDQLPQKPFVLLAESFSGPLGIAIAANPPTHLKGLILSCSFASNPRPLTQYARVLLALPAPMPPFPLIEIALMGQHGNAAIREALRKCLAQVPARVLRHRLAQVLSIDYTSRLAHVHVPLMYLQATADRLVPPKTALTIQSLAPHMQLQPIQGPHLLLQTKPQEAADFIKRFLMMIN